MTVTSSTIASALEARASIYTFDPEAPVSDDDITAIVTAGRHASSWRNSQPWAFIVLRRGTAEAAAFAQTLAPGNDAWVPRAGATIVALQERIHEAYGPDDPDYAAYDLGQAVGSMAIEAHVRGLDTHQFAGFDHAAARTVLGVPDNWTVVVGLAVGTQVSDAAAGDDVTAALLARDEAKKVKSRKPSSETVFVGRFGARA